MMNMEIINGQNDVTKSKMDAKIGGKLEKN